MLKCWVCSEHNFYIEIRETFNVNRIDKPISALRSRCISTSSVDLHLHCKHIYVVVVHVGHVSDKLMFHNNACISVQETNVDRYRR